MATYVGEIKISDKNGFYVNFYPGYLLNGRSFEYLTRQDISALLPGSQYPNINLISTSSAFRLHELFMDGDDVVLDFEPEDLMANLKGDGTRYPTAWKLDISRDFGSTIRRMEDLGYSCLVNAQEVVGDWQTSDRLVIDSPDINEGMNVMIPIDQDRIYLGPLKVRYDEQSDELYVRPGMDGQKQILSGFEFEGGVGRYALVLEQEDVVRRYVETSQEGIRPYMIDRISETELLENFREILGARLPRQFRFDPESAAQMIRIYQNSLLSSYKLSPETAQKRAETLQNLFDAQFDFEKALDTVSSMAGLLLRNFSDQNVYRKVLEALSKDPEFLDQIGTFREFSRMEDKKRREIARLEMQEEELQSQVSELQQMNAQKRIEEAQEKLDRLELLRDQAARKLDEILEKTSLVQSLDDLKKQSAFLREENERKQQETVELETRLQTLHEDLSRVLEQSSQKALEMSFDGLIAQKLAEESARRQRQSELDRYGQASRALFSLPENHLDSEQIVGILVHTLQEERVGFSKNMVLNLLICLAQSPLTLFYGPAGSGKTTTVESAARALGLSQIHQAAGQAAAGSPVDLSRFVSVSVERGWASKKDWIGVYNSVLQNVDVSHPALFDLLSVLDVEARTLNESQVFPALVLLDNANLSGMEYYWSDFLSSKEEEQISTRLEFARGLSLQIPSWLHFAATIQNDHSAEPLSPRILDRSFVVAMPVIHQEEAGSAGPSLSSVPSIRLHTLKKALVPEDPGRRLPEELEENLQTLYEIFEENGYPVSLRSRKAVRSYLHTALRWFEPEMEDEELHDVQSTALDFAMLQRLLPRLNGSSSSFRSFLEELSRFAQTNALSRSEAKLEQIMAAGDEAMQYYQFFEA